MLHLVLRRGGAAAGPSCAFLGSIRLQHSLRAEQHTGTAAQDHNTRVEVDSWGAVSSIPHNDPAPDLRPTNQQGYINHDGLRVDDGRYKRFLEAAGGLFQGLCVWSPWTLLDRLVALPGWHDASNV